jgi:hypothetical protein
MEDFCSLLLVRIRHQRQRLWQRASRESPVGMRKSLVNLTLRKENVISVEKNETLQ